jgi:hypothetical protein
MERINLSILLANIRGGCANDLRRRYGIEVALQNLSSVPNCILIQESWTDLSLQFNKDTPYSKYSEISCGFGHLGVGNGLEIVYNSTKVRALESKVISSRLLLLRTENCIIINAEKYRSTQRNIDAEKYRSRYKAFIFARSRRYAHCLL